MLQFQPLALQTTTDVDSALALRAALGVPQETLAFLSRKPAVAPKVTDAETAQHFYQAFQSAQAQALAQQYPLNARKATTAAEYASVLREQPGVPAETPAFLYLLCPVAPKATTAEIAPPLNQASQYAP